MKIVTLGATGFVGRALLPMLSQQGHEVLVLTRQSATPGHVRLVPGCQPRTIDPYDSAALSAALAGADAVINLVGILNEPRDNGAGFQRAHVDLPERLVEAMREQGVSRLLQMSALGVNEGESHYLKSRARAERLLRSQSAWLDLTIFRPSVIFGRYDSFINRFHDLVRISPVLPMARAGAKFQPVWVGDVAAAFCQALARRDSIGQQYELGGPERFTLRQIVQQVAEGAGLRRRVLALPDSIGSLQARVMGLMPGRPFTLDNFRSLATDSVCENNALPKLGIEPRRLGSVLPDILARSARRRRYSKAQRKAGRSGPPREPGAHD